MSKRELSPDVRVMPEPTEPEHILRLKKARAKIADPINWIKGAYVRYSIERQATSYCLLGSIGWGNRGRADDAGLRAAWAITDVIGAQIIADFNDAANTTHADVLAALDLAIEQATKEWLANRWHGGEWLTF